MSKKISALILLGGLAGMMTSCTDEPLNAECDIEAVSLHFEEPERLMYHDYDTLQTVPSVVDSVSFLVRNYARIGSVPLTLRVTEGATPYLMSADGQWEVFRNGSSVDFSNEQVRRFRIVSQDKAWERFYKIVVLHDVPSEGDMSFDFEDYQLDPTNSEKFYIWSVKGNAVNVFTDGMWKNGNPGYKLSKSSAKPDEYPSVPLPGQGPDGSACLKLETCDTGPFGRMVNMRLASGSMFNGIFDVANALKDALKATQFGSPFKHKPVRISAWLRFERGETFQDKEANPVPGVVGCLTVVNRNDDTACEPFPGRIELSALCRALSVDVPFLCPHRLRRQPRAHRPHERRVARRYSPAPRLHPAGLALLALLRPPPPPLLHEDHEDGPAQGEQGEQ